VVTEQGFRGREEMCVLRGHSGMEALGGGLFEEVVRPPLGNCSLNTHFAGPGSSGAAVEGSRIVVKNAREDGHCVIGMAEVDSENVDGTIQ
jgi:hypothetical protein